MHVPTFIERKRDGGELSNADIEEFIRGYTSGEIPDYQASALEWLPEIAKTRLVSATRCAISAL